MHEFSGLFFLVFALLGSISLIFIGWSSNNKYSNISFLRIIAQIVSYEIVLSLSLLPVFIISSSFNLFLICSDQKNVWNVFFFLPFMIIFFLALLAETGRTPFDLHEPESEVIGGPFTLLSGINYALIYLAEYSSILFYSYFFVIIFFGGWNFLDFNFIFLYFYYLF